MFCPATICGRFIVDEPDGLRAVGADYSSASIAANGLVFPISGPSSTNSRGADLRTPPHGTWRASPRWAAVKGDGCIVVEQNPESKIAAEAHARKFRVENCSQEDLDEINPTRVEEYGGY